MSVELSVLIGLAGTVSGMVVGILSARRSGRREAEERGQGAGTMLTEIGYIKSGVDDIKRKQDRQDAQFLRLAERMAAVEASALEAHRRIDRMEERNDD